MAEDSDPSQLLESFIRHVQRLAEETSYQHLKGILEDNAILRDRNHVLNITNHENIKTMAQIQQQLADEATRAEEQSAKLASLTKENADLTERISFLEGESETTKAQLDESKDEISKLQAELGIRDAEIETTKAQLDASTDEALQLQGELATKDTEIGSTNAKLEESTNEISKLNEEMTSKDTQIEMIKAQLGESADESAKLRAELGDCYNEIEGLKQDIEQEKSHSTTARLAEEEARTELQSTRDELEAKKTRLNEVDALTFKMKNPPHAITQQQLHGMFNGAYKWAEELFGNDLEESVFAPSSSAIWARMRNHKRVSRIIPLPLSNTPEAKNMRVAAILAILAWSFTRYIFQPTYLLQCNELADLLTGLADDDPARENYLRSTLLPILPSKQKENGKKRIEQVVADVFGCIEPILPKGHRDGFRSSLEATCKQVCGQWMRLQLLEEKIEPSFDAYDDEDWKLLHLPSFGAPSKGQAPIDSTEPSGENPTGLGDDSAGTSEEDPESSGNNSTEESAITDDRGIGDIEDIAAVLWPSFLSSRAGESELLTEGFVLSKSQVKAAHDEERAAMLQGVHRAARQIARKDRTKSFAAATADEVGSMKSFLPIDPESGGGLEGGGD